MINSRLLAILSRVSLPAQAKLVNVYHQIIEIQTYFLCDPEGDITTNGVSYERAGLSPLAQKRISEL